MNVSLVVCSVLDYTMVDQNDKTSHKSRLVALLVLNGFEKFIGGREIPQYKIASSGSDESCGVCLLPKNNICDIVLGV